MNARITPTRNLDEAVKQMIRTVLTPDQRRKLSIRKAKLIMIDGEWWFIDLGGGNDRKSETRG